MSALRGMSGNVLECLSSCPKSTSLQRVEQFDCVRKPLGLTREQEAFPTKTNNNQN